MTTTAPFTAAVADLVTGPHRVAAMVTATTPGYPPVTLDVLGGTLSWVETRSPRVAGDITCSLPADAAALDTALDPRRPVRVQVTITYTLPGGGTDSQTVANLGLRARSVDRPNTELTLTLASDEALAIDASPVAAYGVPGGDGSEPDTVTKPNGPAWIRQVITGLLAPVVPTFVTTCPAAPAEWPYGQPRDMWDAITDMADQLNIDVYDNGDRVFRLAPRATVTAAATLALKTGPGGTILSSDADVTRDDWANYVAVRYEWTNSAGVTKTQYGTARVTTGPYAVTGGYRNLVEQRDTAASKAAANAAAAAILGRMLARSRGYRLEAVAAWWVRPGHTITVNLPTTGEARHLVSDVTYDLAVMTMSLTTRLPDTASTIGE